MFRILVMLHLAMLAADHISQDDAARHFQVTTRTIRNWIGQGRVKGYRYGPRDVRVSLGEIDRMLSVTKPSLARDGRRLYGPYARILDMTKNVG